VLLRRLPLVAGLGVLLGHRAVRAALPAAALALAVAPGRALAPTGPGTAARALLCPSRALGAAALPLRPKTARTAARSGVRAFLGVVGCSVGTEGGGDLGTAPASTGLATASGPGPGPGSAAASAAAGLLAAALLRARRDLPPGRLVRRRVGCGAGLVRDGLAVLGTGAGALGELPHALGAGHADGRDDRHAQHRRVPGTGAVRVRRGRGDERPRLALLARFRFRHARHCHVQR